MKAENAVDFSGLIHQAIVILRKAALSARGSIFWLMNFRISAAARSVVSGITQAKQSDDVVAVGDDWQAIYRFSGAQMSLPPLSMKTLVKAIAVI